MKLFLKAATVAVICTSFIGSTSAAEMSLGLKGGLNLATTWGGEDVEGVDQVMKPGLIIGAALEMKLSENFSVQPEVLFSSKGSKIKGDEYGVESIYTTNMNYLEIPILLKLNIPAGFTVPNFYIGPAIGFRVGVSGKGKMGSLEMDMTDDMIDEIKESTNAFDFGLAMGGGCNFTAGPGAVVLDIRYTLGFLKLAKLSDADKDLGVTESDLPGDKNGVLSFMVGYAINFGG